VTSRPRRIDLRASCLVIVRGSFFAIRENRTMRLLDLFCGAGGAARGYQEAGFHVTGVDVRPQPRYAGDVFVQADAMTYPLDGYDAIHASPPCQGYSRMRHLPWLRDREYPMLIDPVRERLLAAGVPFVIENVEDAPLAKAPGLFGLHGVVLCGTMFGLAVFRHRPFESNVMIGQPVHYRHVQVVRRGRMLGARARVPVRRGITPWQEDGGVAGHMGNVDRVRDAMRIPWMVADELAQAIPPAYTHHIGVHLADELALA
jgi:DNA (cytosine-5)-methyltransferase 1